MLWNQISNQVMHHMNEPNRYYNVMRNTSTRGLLVGKMEEYEPIKFWNA